MGLGSIFGIFTNNALEYVQKDVFHSSWPTIPGTTFQSPVGNWTVGIGVDDVIQTVLGFGAIMAFPKNKYFGMGMILGTFLTKVGEIYGTKVQFFSTAANRVPKSAADLTDTSGVLPDMPGVFSGGNYAQASVDRYNPYLENTAPFLNLGLYKPSGMAALGAGTYSTAGMGGFLI